MKKFFPLLFLTSCFFLVSLEKAEAKKLRRFLEFEGVIYQTGYDAKGNEKYLDSAFIVVVDEVNKTCDTVYSGESGEYYFRLALNRKFLITVSKKGFVSKKLHADTHVPLFAHGKNAMEFEMDLFQEIPGLDVSILDAPVAEIKYNGKKNSFDYNRTYTDLVNRELKKMYATYYVKKSVVGLSCKKPQNTAVAKENRNRKGRGRILRLRM